MKKTTTILVAHVILFCFISHAYSYDKNYSIKDVIKLVPSQTSNGWWHKQFNSMEGNRYLSSFQSTEHKGKLNWNKDDIKEGKIQIVNAMQLAQQWAVDHKPFGENNWEIENATLLFRAAENEIEYIYAIMLKTEDYKTIEVIVLPSQEVIPPEINPEF